MIFLVQFGKVVDPNTLYQHFATMRREPSEPIRAFNAHFQKVYSRITPSNKPMDALALEIYKNFLDPMINIFLKRAMGINTLSLAYVEAINIYRQLNPQGKFFPVEIQVNHDVLPSNPTLVINVSSISWLPLNQPLGIARSNVPDPSTNSTLIPINSSAHAPSLRQNKNELEAIQRMVQKLKNDFTSLQR